MKTARRWIVCLIAAGVCWLSAGNALAQFAANARGDHGNPHKDKNAVWNLDLKFKDPRMIRVYVPGQGTRIYWYLWYQVINRTGEPRKFIPYFEIVTLDYPAAFADGIYPTVEDAIRKLEDPTGYRRIKNSVTISAECDSAVLPPRPFRGPSRAWPWEANSTGQSEEGQGRRQGTRRHDAIQHLRSRPVQRVRGREPAGGGESVVHALQNVRTELSPHGGSLLARFA